MQQVFSRDHNRTVESDSLALARRSLPALITGGAGDDPSGVVTYTIVGATTGMSQLWLLLLSTPMLAAAITMAGRVALANQAGLSAVITRRYGRPVGVAMILVLAAANIATITADTAGVAAVLEMLTGMRWEFFVPLILLALWLILRAGYGRLKKALTVLALVLLIYIIVAVLAQPDWGIVLKATLLPQFSTQKGWVIAALGLLGTTISPYMLFWQANEDVEELHLGTMIRAADETASVWIGMIFSNVISYFIIVAAAVTIHNGAGQIQSVADAAQALLPLGQFGDEVFSIGILGAGLLALPVLSGSTAYAIAEVFGWPEGMSARAVQARGFYAVLAASLVGGAFISLWPSFDPVHALFYSQVLNGMLLPVVMIVLLILSNDRRVIGGARNPLWVNVFAVLTIVLGLGANLLALLGN